MSDPPTLLEEFALLLEELDLGTYRPLEPGGTIYLNTSPSEPDRCLVLARYAGPESDATDDYDEPSIQVRVRGPASDSRIAERDADAVYDRLHAIGSRELPGGTWLQDMIGAQSGPIYIGVDTSSGRHEFTVNFQAEVSRPSTNRS